MPLQDGTRESRESNETRESKGGTMGFVEEERGRIVLTNSSRAGRKIVEDHGADEEKSIAYPSACQLSIDCLLSLRSPSWRVSRFLNPHRT